MVCFFEDEIILPSRQWCGAMNTLTYKAPTCVLLNPSKEFKAFGYEAESEYSNLADSNEHQGWMLFRNFKEILCDEKVFKEYHCAIHCFYFG